MGHVRLKRLPASQKWQHVVALLIEGASVNDLATASADAAEAALRHAREDPVLIESFWLLTQLPLAARAPSFIEATRRVGLELTDKPSLLEVVAAYSDAVDRANQREGRLTDFGEIARRAGSESLSAFVGADLPGLFAPEPGEVVLALGKLAAPDRFAKLTRDYFARLTTRHLDYYLSRAIPDHVGPTRQIATVADHAAFNAALEQHCREASRIVEEFAGGWYSKTNYLGGITPTKARGFIFVALRKISDELNKRRSSESA